MVMPEMIVLVIYFAFTLFVGLYVAKKFPTRSYEDWSTGSRTLNWVVNYFTAHASQLSALQYMGFVSFIYIYGFAMYYAHYIFYMLTTCAFFMIFSVKVWRLGKKYGHMTPTDVLTHYFGDHKILRYTVAVMLFLGLIPYLQVQVTGGAYLFGLATHGRIPFWVGAALIYAIIMVYTWAGGLRSIAWNDFFHGLLLLLGLWGGGALIIWKWGGGPLNVWHTAMQVAPEKLYISGYKGWDWKWVITWGIPIGFGWAAHAHMWLRQYTPKDRAGARKWPAMMLMNNIITGTIMAFVGVTLAIVMPGKEEVADKLFLQTLGSILNPWVYGLILAAALAAMMSTVDSQAHALSLVVTRDMLEGAGIKLSEKQRILASRVTTVIALTAGLILAFVAPNYLAWIGGYAASLGLILLPPLICALTGVKIVTWKGVTVGIIGGFIAMVVANLKHNPYGIYFGFYGLVVELILMVVVSLLTPKDRPSKEVVEEFKATPW